jgi:hypothetical protein
MYRNLLKITLERNELLNRNKHAPKNFRYCNGVCQDYLSIGEFSGTGKIIKSMCRTCRNILNLGSKFIKNQQITLEEFKNNPYIVYGKNNQLNGYKICRICKQTKGLFQFEPTSVICKSCRAIQVTNLNDKDLEKYTSEMMVLKNDLKKLETFLQSIPKNKLIKIISHFRVGRKATDKKENMVHNLVEFFRNLMGPKYCMAGCGLELENSFNTCEECQSNSTKKHISIVEFQEKILPGLMKYVTHLSKEDAALYNKEQIVMIAVSLGLSPKHIQKKETIVEMINNKLEKRLKKRQEPKQNNESSGLEEISVREEENSVKISQNLDDIVMSVREDGFIDATQLCKTGGKRFDDWYRRKETKELIKALSLKISKPENQLVISDRRYRNFLVHPDLGICLLQWIFPARAIQIAEWVRKMIIQKNSEKDCEKISNDPLQTEIDRFKCLEQQHNDMLLKRSYYKFDKGDVFYIISDIDGKSVKYKVGVSNNINSRLQQHRSTTPGIKLEYLIYLEDPDLVEQTILTRYRDARKYLNHEWIYDTNILEIIHAAELFLNSIGKKFKQTEIELYNKQIEVHNGSTYSGL